MNMKTGAHELHWTLQRVTRSMIQCSTWTACGMCEAFDSREDSDSHCYFRNETGLGHINWRNRTSDYVTNSANKVFQRIDPVRRAILDVQEAEDGIS